MSKNLRERAEATAQEIQKILGVTDQSHTGEVVQALEHSIIRALIEERERCAIVAREWHEDDKKGKAVSDQISKVRSVLISNLSAMR